MRCKHLLLLRFHWSLLEWLGGDRQLHPEIFGSHLNRLESLTLMILDRKTKGGTSACLASFPPTSMGLRSCLPHFHFVGRTNLATLFLKEGYHQCEGSGWFPFRVPKVSHFRSAYSFWASLIAKTTSIGTNPGAFVSYLAIGCLPCWA